MSKSFQEDHKRSSQKGGSGGDEGEGRVRKKVDHLKGQFTHFLSILPPDLFMSSLVAYYRKQTPLARCHLSVGKTI